MAGQSKRALVPTGEGLKFPRPRAEVSPRGDGANDAPRSVAAVERLGISTPIKFYALLLKSEEYHKSGNRNSARECRSSYAERKQAIGTAE